MDHPFGRPLRFRSSSCGLRAGYGVQVGGQNPPPYPSAEAFFALLPASVQVPPPFHHADAPLDPRPKPPRSSEPPFSLVALALFGLSPLLGQRYSSYPHASDGIFVG